MADVKWIKIYVDMFENKKIKQLEAMPEGDTLIVIWYKLLCLAGKINDSGVIYFSEDIPFDADMLAVEFKRPVATVKLALTTFLKFKMIELVDDMVLVSNWEKYQQVDKLSEIREQNRLRKQQQRARNRALIPPNNKDVNDMSRDSHVTVSVTSQQCHAIDIEEDIDIYNNINRYTDKLISAHAHEGESSLYSKIENIKEHIDSNGLDYTFYKTLDFYVAPYYYTMKLNAFTCKQVNSIYLEDMSSGLYDKDRLVAVLLYTLDWCIKCNPKNFIAYFKTAYKKNKELYFNREV